MYSLYFILFAISSILCACCLFFVFYGKAEQAEKEEQKIANIVFFVSLVFFLISLILFLKPVNVTPVEKTFEAYITEAYVSDYDHSICVVVSSDLNLKTILKASNMETLALANKRIGEKVIISETDYMGKHYREGVSMYIQDWETEDVPTYKSGLLESKGWGF